MNDIEIVLEKIDQMMAEEMAIYEESLKDGSHKESSAPVVYTRLQMLKSFVENMPITTDDELADVADKYGATTKHQLYYDKEGWTANIGSELSKAFIEGAKWQKEKLLQNAISCKLGWCDGFILDFTDEQLHDIVEKNSLEIGDDVNVTIVKTTEI